jgi:hypothetical protein
VSTIIYRAPESALEITGALGGPWSGQGAVQRLSYSTPVINATSDIDVTGAFPLTIDDSMSIKAKA